MATPPRVLTTLSLEAYQPVKSSPEKQNKNEAVPAGLAAVRDSLTSSIDFSKFPGDLFVSRESAISREKSNSDAETLCADMFLTMSQETPNATMTSPSPTSATGTSTPPKTPNSPATPSKTSLPKTPQQSPVLVNTFSPPTPEIKLPNVVLTAQIRPPAPTHFASFVDTNIKPTGSPNKKLRNFCKDLDIKPVQTVLWGSAEHDVERIREENLKPDDRGIISVPSQSGQGTRIYTLHEKNTQAGGGNSIIPVKGKGEGKGGDIEPFRAKELKKVIDSYMTEKEEKKEMATPTFKDFIKSRVKRKRDMMPK